MNCQASGFLEFALPKRKRSSVQLCGPSSFCGRLSLDSMHEDWVDRRTEQARWEIEWAMRAPTMWGSAPIVRATRDRLLTSILL